MGRRKLVENREEVILKAAKALFQKYGFEKTTMDEIAQEAGIAKGSIYVDFPGKYDILMSLIRRMMQQRLAEIQSALQAAPAGKPRLELMYEILKNHAANVYDNAQESSMNPEMMALTRMRIKEEFRDFFTALYTVITNLIREAMERKEIPTGDPLRHAELFMLGFSSVMPPYHSQYGREQHLDNIEDLLSLLIAGLKEGIKPKGKSGCTGLH